MTADELRRRSDAINWWHDGIDLGQNVITHGRSKFASVVFPYLDLPLDLTGKTVLDVGTWDGFMAWECEHRHAARVVAVDSYAWRLGTRDAGFQLAHEQLHSRVEAVVCEVEDLSPARLGMFDLVLFLGVLYHMRHPLLALERVAAMTDGLLIVESHIDLADDALPAMRFYPGNELGGDASNWWGPNPACIEAMLRDVGFDDVRCILPHGSRVTFHATKRAG